MNELMISEKKLVEYLDIVGVGKGITKTEKMQFIEIAKAYGLNPFKREIYIAAYGLGDSRQCSILIGYEVYLKRAEESGQLDGYEVTTEGEIPNLKAIITIWRKDRSRPFVHNVEYQEYVQRDKSGNPNKFWREKPKTMLKKVVMSQGFRLCFPVDLGGMPYTAEEVGADEALDVTPKVAEVQQKTEHITGEEIQKKMAYWAVMGIDNEDVKNYYCEKYGVKSGKELTPKQWQEVCTYWDGKADDSQSEPELAEVA